ncbi:hypothetical protein SNE40_018075 [Patella caerulea]
MAESPDDLKIGDKFDSFKAVEHAISKFESLQKISYWRRDSRTIKYMLKRGYKCVENEDLWYWDVTFSCVKGGRTYNSKSSGVRPNQRQVFLHFFLNIYNFVGKPFVTTSQRLLFKAIWVKLTNFFGVYSEKFPAAKLQLCLFHVLRTMKREINCEKMGICIEKNLCIELIQKLAYSTNEEE